MSEPDFDIDAAGEQFDAGKDLDQSPKGGDNPPPDDDGNQATPPGFLGFQEYVDQGGDPDRYVGRTAYEERYANIQDNKQLKRELKTVRQSVQQTMEAVNDWQGQERDRIRTELEGQLHQAKEDEDVNGAIEAQRKLDQHDANDKPPAQQQRQEHPVIQEFREANVMLDHDAEEFDEEFNADVEALFNAKAGALSNGFKSPLKDGQIKRCLKQAVKEARELHDLEGDAPPANDPPPAKESQRNQRRGGGQGQGRRRSQQTAPAAKAENFTIRNPRNPRQTDAASEVRDMIAQKYGDDAAKEFEKNLMSE